MRGRRWPLICAYGRGVDLGPRVADPNDRGKDKEEEEEEEERRVRLFRDKLGETL